MNYAIVFRLLSYILFCEAALLLLPATASLCYGEWSVLGVFVLTAALCLVLGLLLRRIKPSSKVFYMREGFATTALSWVVISIMGAIPFVLTGCIPNPVDAMFETVSGFTTTGASILPAVEGLPKGVLFWRSFTHWIGGMGVLVFLLSLLPLTGGSHVNLMKAESPGPQVDKLVPKVQSTAKILYGIYFALTVLEFLFLLVGRMPVFDAMLTAFGTAGTGGFGFKNDSFGSLSPYIQWVVTIFMILFGVNFNTYFLLLLRRFRRAAASEEVRGYFLIILVATGIITLNIHGMYDSLGAALRHAAFQVGSIITTTGFSSCDFDLWPTLSKEVLVMLMFVGACAGSTGGGIKVSRFLILGKTLGKELKQALHPQVVAPAGHLAEILKILPQTKKASRFISGEPFLMLEIGYSSTFSCARYCSASSRESSSNNCLPARSATVRATRRMRSWARAERPSVSYEARRSRSAAGVIRQTRRTCPAVSRALQCTPSKPGAAYRFA